MAHNPDTEKWQKHFTLKGGTPQDVLVLIIVLCGANVTDTAYVEHTFGSGVRCIDFCNPKNAYQWERWNTAGCLHILHRFFVQMSLILRMWKIRWGVVRMSTSLSERVASGVAWEDESNLRIMKWQEHLTLKSGTPQDVIVLFLEEKQAGVSWWIAALCT